MQKNDIIFRIFGIKYACYFYSFNSTELCIINAQVAVALLDLWAAGMDTCHHHAEWDTKTTYVAVAQITATTNAAAKREWIKWKK